MRMSWMPHRWSMPQPQSRNESISARKFSIFSNPFPRLRGLFPYTIAYPGGLDKPSFPIPADFLLIFVTVCKFHFTNMQINRSFLAGTQSKTSVLKFAKIYIAFSLFFLYHYI